MATTALKPEKKKLVNVLKRWSAIRVRGLGAMTLSYSDDERASWVDAGTTLNERAPIDAYSRTLSLKVGSTSGFEITSFEVWGVVRGSDT